MSTTKEQMIIALKQLNNAVQEINKLWESDVNLDELTEHGKKYPFNDSFDEVVLQVAEWVDLTVEELAKK